SSSFPAEARFVPNVRHAAALSTTRNLRAERDWMCIVCTIYRYSVTAAPSGRNPYFAACAVRGRVYVQRPVRNTVKIDRDCRSRVCVGVWLEEVSPSLRFSGVGGAVQGGESP